MEKEFDQDDFWLSNNKNDENKKVLITKGWFKHETGTVMYGPFQNEYEIKDGFKSIYKISKPNWYVHVPSIDKCLYFAESEIQFI